MIPLGVSVSDLALAVKVIYKVCGAFRDASGADQQYASTVTFLDAFARTFERMIEYTEDTLQLSSNANLTDDLTAQMRLIYAEYTKFDDYLKKVEPGLSSKSITSRLTARAKWAIKELDEKVNGLKRAVIGPMMLVTPLLAVEVLRELKEIRSQLPAKENYEAAIRQNSKVILQVNSDLAHLRSNLNAWWWNRRWAMTAVEEDVKTLKSLVKTNTDLIENSRAMVQESISRETQKQAASNVEAITVLETVMASRLSSIEAQLDQLIYDTRGRTGKDDKELGNIKTRIANARLHLHQAAKSARQCLKSFGLLVIAVNDVHSNILPPGMLPFAKILVGYNKIYEAGQKFVNFGGQTIESGGKCVEENDMLAGLKSWNPFTAAVHDEKARLEAARVASTPDTKPGSEAVSEKQPVIERTRAPTMQDEGYDSGDENEKAATLVSPSARRLSGSTPLDPKSIANLDAASSHQQTTLLEVQDTMDLLSFEEDDTQKTVQRPLAAERTAPVIKSMDPASGLDHNPWA